MKIAKSLWTLSIKNPSQAFYFTDRLKLLMLKKKLFFCPFNSDLFIVRIEKSDRGGRLCEYKSPF